MNTAGDALVIFLLGILIGILFMGLATGSVYKSRAIEHGCAQYNPTTADFEWLDTLSVPKDGVSTCTP